MQRNVFQDKTIAESYDNYYRTDFGITVDSIEKKIIDELLNSLSSREMLELGCGTGHWTEHFEKLGYSVTALDISQPMLDIAEKRDLKADFLKADAEALPFRDGSMSLITSITMLEFVDDLEKALSEMRRVLKKGGSLVLGCLNAESLLGKNKQNDPTFKNAVFFTDEDFETKFSGFEIVKIRKGIYLRPDYSLADEAEDKEEYEPAFTGISFRRK
ncbi:MAG: methyltransferase domain-containing protein [Candidatus Delongbacteria bacterium]|nr:methyltransferase domain-containing protein [Candidatus Delongbacteria bacterium]